MRINPIVYGVLVLSIFFAVILGFQAAGIWSTSGKVDASGNAIQPAAGDANSIKGWMTLEQITTTFNVPLAELAAQFKLPADIAPSTAIKDLESDSFDTTGLRTWLQSRGQAGGAVATSEPKLTVTPTLPPPAAGNTNPTPVATVAATVHAAAEKTITGKTTFQEVLDWGVSKEAIQKVIGEMPLPSAVIKDYVTGKGQEFTTVKTQLQTEVDKTK
jgi:hypothetical protein